MFKTIRTGILLFLMLTVITGIIYPLGVTIVASLVFPKAAHGSVIYDGDQAVGSELLGQSFTTPNYLWGRPSATGPFPYNGLAGSGSNQATTNPALVTVVTERVAQLRAADPGNNAAIPVDLVTASASGLDPHISPAAAKYQASRVARERNLTLEQVTSLIQQHTEGATLGFLGQPRVHVLRLNRALDAQK